MAGQIGPTSFSLSKIRRYRRWPWGVFGWSGRCENEWLVLRVNYVDHHDVGSLGLVDHVAGTDTRAEPIVERDHHVGASVNKHPAIAPRARRLAVVRPGRRVMLDRDSAKLGPLFGHSIGAFCAALDDLGDPALRLPGIEGLEDHGPVFPFAIAGYEDLHRSG